MNKKKNPMIATVAAARELRKVPGFDPLKYLRTVSKDGEKVLKLDLRFKRLWFRLACPNGRMLLNPLRITDQMAIFEARVYAHKDDASPLASFTSTQMAQNIPGGLYIRAAQDEALNEALDNAGFGIQLCDVVQVSDGSGFGSEIPLSHVEAAMQTTASAGVPAEDPPVKKHETAATSTASAEAAVPAPVPQELIMASAENDVQTPKPAEPPVEETAEPVPAMETPVPHPRAEVSITDGPQGTANVAVLPVAPPAEAVDAAKNAQPTNDTAVQSGYTEDMTVEEICERMTLEEARDILVPLGTCKGWTLGQVLDRRPTSLRWYTVGCSEASNVLKAGATLLWNAREMQKAG